MGDFSFRYNDEGDFYLHEEEVDAVRFFVVSEFEMQSEVEVVSGMVSPDWTPADNPPIDHSSEKPVIVFHAPSEATIKAISPQPEH